LARLALQFRRAAAAALLLAALCVSPATAAAQCPLCRSALQDAGDKTARTMNLAILVLLIPPVSIFCTIFAVAYRRRQGEDGGFDDGDDQGLEP
jgi:hypothetical protein